MKRSYGLKSYGLIIVVVLVMGGVVTAVSAFSYTVESGDTLTKIAEKHQSTVSAIAQANNISNPNLIYVDQILQIPDGSTPITPPSTDPPPTETSTYTVQRGDTLFRIATRFNTTVSALAQANNLGNANLIYVGQILTIPNGSGSPINPPPPSGNPPPNTGSFGLGGQTQTFANADLMQRSGMNWVKLQHKWAVGDDPQLLAGRIHDAHKKGFKILISVTGKNTYPASGTIDFAAFAEFMGGVAALGPDALEVWNEMNIDFEWPAGEINPQDYVQNMLKPAYQAIKANNPNVLVISGALAPTGFDNGTNAWADDRYLAGMNSAGASAYADCIGVHHNAGATSPHVSAGHPGGSHYSWYFQPTLNLYYNSFGGSKPLCFTELGYLSGDGYGGLPTNFAWASNNSTGDHAQWLADAVTVAKNSGKVMMVIVFNVDFTYFDPNGDPQAGYAMLRPDGSCPACDKLADVMR